MAAAAVRDDGVGTDGGDVPHRHEAVADARIHGRRLRGGQNKLLLLLHRGLIFLLLFLLLFQMLLRLLQFLSLPT